MSVSGSCAAIGGEEERAGGGRTFKGPGRAAGDALRAGSALLRDRGVNAAGREPALARPRQAGAARAGAFPAEGFASRPRSLACPERGRRRQRCCCFRLHVSQEPAGTDRPALAALDSVTEGRSGSGGARRQLWRGWKKGVLHLEVGAERRAADEEADLTIN